MTCQGNCGIQTGPDPFPPCHWTRPFSSLPNGKEQSGHARLIVLSLRLLNQFQRLELYIFKVVEADAGEHRAESCLNLEMVEWQPRVRKQQGLQVTRFIKTSTGSHIH